MAQDTGLPVPKRVPEEEEALFQKGMSYKDQEEKGLAISAFEQFSQKYPSSSLLPDIYSQLGHLYTKHESRKLHGILKDFIEKFPNDFRINEVRLKLSEAYLLQGSLSEALFLWNNIEGEEEARSEVYDKASQWYYGRKEYYKALEILMEKKKVMVGHLALDTHEQTVVALVKEKLSESDLERVVNNFGAQSPVDEAIIRLTALYEKQGDYYHQEREAQRFLSLFPNHAGSSEMQTIASQVQNKIKAHHTLIAAVFPLSGKLAPFGNSALNGAQLAMKQFKETNPTLSVGLVVKDVEANSHLTDMTKWLDEYHPVAMVGPLLTKDVDRVAPYVERTGMALITPGATGGQLVSLGRSVLRNAITLRAQCLALTEYAANERELKSYAILYPKNKYGAEWAKCLSEEIAKHGGEVVHAEPYPLNESDFSYTIRRLKEVDLKKKGKAEIIEDRGKKREISYAPGFEAIFLPGEASQIGLMIPQLVFHNVRDVVLFGSNGWNSPDLIKLSGAYANEAIFIDGFFEASADPVVQKFAGQYRRRHQEAPDIFAAQAYDATRLILSAIEKGITTPHGIKATLMSTRQFSGASGLIHEVKEGEFIKTPVLLTVRKGKIVQLN